MCEINKSGHNYRVIAPGHIYDLCILFCKHIQPTMYVGIVCIYIQIYYMQKHAEYEYRYMWYILPYLLLLYMNSAAYSLHLQVSRAETKATTYVQCIQVYVYSSIATTHCYQYSNSILVQLYYVVMQTYTSLVVFVQQINIETVGGTGQYMHIYITVHI